MFACVYFVSENNRYVLSPLSHFMDQREVAEHSGSLREVAEYSGSASRIEFWGSLKFINYQTHNHMTGKSSKLIPRLS
jgi:hypothetical protein